MKKYIITLFMLFILPTINLYSNFRCIMDGNLDFNGDTLNFYMFYKGSLDPDADGGMLMVSSDESIIIKQLATNYTKFYTPLSTGVDWKAPVKYFLSEPPIFYSGLIPVYADRVFVYGDSSITQILDIDSYPELTRTFNIDVLSDDGNGTINSGLILRTAEDYGSFDRIIYFVTNNSIVKIINDSVAVNVPLPDELISTTPQKTNMVFYPIDSTLTITRNNDGVIGFYNVYTKEIKTFDYKTLPVGEYFKIIKCSFVADIDDKINGQSTYSDVNLGFYVIDSSNFKLLIYNLMDKTWSVENIGYPTNSVIYNPNIYPEIDSVFSWPYSSDMIAVSFKTDPTVIHDLHSLSGNSQETNLRSLCLYNLKTKGWADFLIPLEVFKGYTPDMDYLLHPKQVAYYNQHLNTIGILYDNFLIEYDPYNSSIKDIASIDEGINVYPNPIRRSCKVDIMCYVQDLSKIDIGLYDIIGRKILDLNNNYEYNPITHTITTSIEVLPGTPNGTYYLNVRNGSEFRTHAVVIEK